MLTFRGVCHFASLFKVIQNLASQAYRVTPSQSRPLVVGTAPKSLSMCSWRKFKSSSSSKFHWVFPSLNYALNNSLCDSCSKTCVLWLQSIWKPGYWLKDLSLVNIRYVWNQHYCWWKNSCTSWCTRYPSIQRVLYMPGGAGFLPSTLSMESWCSGGCSRLLGCPGTEVRING